MAKKNFKSPVDQFITIPSINNTTEENTDKLESISIKRHTPPEGMKINPLYIEKRSKRVQLVLQPSLYEKIKEESLAHGQSVNDYIHQALEKAVIKT